MQFITSDNSLLDNGDTKALQFSQWIPPEHISALRAELAHNNANRCTTEMHRVVSVPVAVHELWLRQGFDMTREPLDKIKSRLRRDGLDCFIVSEKA